MMKIKEIKELRYARRWNRRAKFWGMGVRYMVNDNWGWQLPDNMIGVFPVVIENIEN